MPSDLTVNGRQAAVDVPRGHALLGVPWLVLIALVVIAAGSLVLRNYRVGRELYAMGSSPQAAELAGIQVTRNLIGAFVVCGALAGSRRACCSPPASAPSTPAAGTGYELNVVAAVVVGGVAVFGGSGTVWGAALGALLLTVIGSALAVLDINQFWQQAIVGVADPAGHRRRPAGRATGEPGR